MKRNWQALPQRHRRKLREFSAQVDKTSGLNRVPKKNHPNFSSSQQNNISENKNTIHAIPTHTGQKETRNPDQENENDNVTVASRHSGSNVEINIDDYDYFDITKGEMKYEYLDHTADVQIHAWGDSLKEAYAQTVVAMFGYMTNLELVDIDREQGVRKIYVQADDKKSLLRKFLEECLFVFHTEQFIMKHVHVLSLCEDIWSISAVGVGEIFSLQKHEQGTEVKAITYSAMKVLRNGDIFDIYVIVDI